MGTTLRWRLTFAFLAFLLPGRLLAQPCPGDLCPRVQWDPPGAESTQVAVHVPSRGEYFVVTNEGNGTTRGLVGRFLSPSGAFGPVMTLLPGNDVTLVAMAHNPDRDEILLVTRDASPANLRGLYLDGGGVPIGSPFFIDSGEEPQVAYSPESRRYLVTWSRLGSDWVTYYAVIDGDSTAPAPVLAVGPIDSSARAGSRRCSGLTYGGPSRQFLVVYEKNGSDVYGRFVSAEGVPGAIFPVDAGAETQGEPCAGHATSNARFLVVYTSKVPEARGFENFVGAFVSRAGAVLHRFPISGAHDFPFTPGPVAYEEVSNSFVLSWDIGKRGAAWSVRAFSAADGAPVTPAVFVEGGDLSTAWLTSLAARSDPLDPQALVVWRGHTLPGVNAGVFHLPRPVTTRISVDTPASAVGPRFPVAGWAADPAAPAGTGVDAVHVWSFSESGGAVFLGSDYGRPRPDVGAFFGDPRFDASGYRVDVEGLAAGDYRIRVYARSTLSRLFDKFHDVLVTVGLDPRIRVEAPVSGATLAAPITVRGFAVDPTSSSGTGVDAVQIWAVPTGSATGTLLGDATYGGSRPDVAAAFGDARFEPSGFLLPVATVLPEGGYTFEVRARSTVTGNFDIVQLVPLQVDVIDYLAVDLPVNGGGVGGPFVVSGWALSTGATAGTGIDAVHVWALSQATGSGLFLGAATLGGSRPDVAAYFGLKRFEPSGFTLTSGPLPPGNHILRVYARNADSGLFETSRDVRVSTLSSSPRAAVDSPTPGATSLPFEVSGWSVDLNASTGTGVDVVHVWAAPASGGSPVFLGEATRGVFRPDVAAHFGRPGFAGAGYRLTVSSLPAGTYTLVVWSRSTVGGTFTNAPPRVVTVP